MNIYDEAYALAKALKESDEQKRLVEAEKALKTNPDAKKMTAEYLVLQQKVSYLQMMHEKDKAEKEYKKLQDMAVLVSNNELAAAYVQAFIRWNQMTSDINKIVVDAMTGQDAVTVAESFNERLGLTGVVLTKMDGDARGGAALSIRAVTGAPVKFVGMGEKLSEMEVFHPDRIAGRILGMGDVLTLVEKAQATIDADEAEALAKKMRKASFDLEDFRTQMRRIKKLGSLDSILKMIPGMGGLREKLAEANGAMPEKEMARTEAIINSMTMAERRNPDILNGSRRARIARGAGVTVQQVNQLVRQFEQMRQMMKGMMGGKAKGMPAMPRMPRGMNMPGGMGGMPGMMPGMGGMPGMPPMGLPDAGHGRPAAAKKRKKRERPAKRKKK